MTTQPKFCKDCKHCDLPGNYHEPKCWHSSSVKYNLVTGSVDGQYCSVVRSLGECGEEAILFNPKESSIVVTKVELTPQQQESLTAKFKDKDDKEPDYIRGFLTGAVLAACVVGIAFSIFG